MKRFLRMFGSRRTWIAALSLWAITLFILSSFSKTMPDGGPEIPHIDKVLHYGYFLGGGIILATCVLLGKGLTASWKLRYFLPIVVLAIVGMLDEYHQTFTPGRSGNDPYDWLADVLGAATGIYLANRFHTLLLKLSLPVAEISKN